MRRLSSRARVLARRQPRAAKPARVSVRCAIGRSQRRPERPNPVRRVVVVDERDARGQRNGRPLAHFDCDDNEVFAIGNFSLNLDLQNLTRFRLGVTLKNGRESTVRAKPAVPIEPSWIGAV